MVKSIRFEIRNKEFYKKTMNIMVLVILQQLITIGINFFDNIMVGNFGETQISAVAFSNQFYSFFQFICMGLGSGAIVMSSQFWGRKELEPMRTVASMAMKLTIVLCAVFTAAGVAFPQLVLGVFTKDQDIITMGIPYMRLVAITFLPAGLASTATYLLRSIGKVKIPLIGSFVAFVLNFFFNYIFIFGKLGAPRLELVGAAVGTLIARVFEFLFVFGYFIIKEKDFGFRGKHFLCSGKSLRRQYCRYSIPVLVSDVLLGLSLLLVVVIMGHVGEEMSAANSMVGSATQVVTVLNISMAGAASVIVGNSIGEGEIARAKREANTYVLYALIIGIIAVPIILLLEKPYLSLYNITDTTKQLAHGMMLCTSCMVPIQTVAYVLSKGVLRGAGDTKFMVFADSCMIWLVSLPLGALAGLVWHLDPVLVYLLIRIEFPLKGVICFIRFCTGKWLKVIKSTDDKETIKS